MEDYVRERARGTWSDRLVKEGFRGKWGWLAKLHLVPVGAGFKHRCPAVGAGMSLECRPGLWWWGNVWSRCPGSHVWSGFPAWFDALVSPSRFLSKETHTHKIPEAHVIGLDVKANAHTLGGPH